MALMTGGPDCRCWAAWRRLAPIALAATLWLLGMTPSALSAAHARVHEYQVKAAFLVNFTKFVSWPESSDPHLVLGIVGDDPFGDTIDEMVEGKQVRGRPIVIKRLRPHDDLRGCHIVFISESARRVTPDLLSRLSGETVLTVGETPQFLRDGGVVRFYLSSDRVQFEIDAARAREAGLKISSQLLSLSK